MGLLLTAAVPVVTAGTDFGFEIGVVPTDVPEGDTPGKILVVGPTAIAAQGGTNFNTLTVQQYRGAALVRALATWNVGTTALVADTPLYLTVATEEIAEFQAGDLIRAAFTHTGTGAGQVTSTIQVELI